MITTTIDGIAFREFSGREDHIPPIVAALRDGLVAMQNARKRGRCTSYDGLLVERVPWFSDRYAVYARATDTVYGVNARLTSCATLEELEVVSEALEGLAPELP